MPYKTVPLLRITAHIITAGLILLSALAIIKSIFLGFDIDEGYAIAQAYRLVKGDKLFLDMWEPHQLSAYGCAVFMAPFLALTKGDTTGLVIYLRIIGTCIHLCIAYGLFRAAAKRFGSFTGLLIALIHTNFLSKWITLPEFELMQYWCVCILFLALLAFSEKPRHANWYLVLSGLALFFSLLSYPTMLLLYPVYLGAVCCLEKGPIKHKIKAVLWFTLPALLAGIGFLCYLASYMSPAAFLESINYIFMDESHSVSLLKRLPDYGAELILWWEQLLQNLPAALLILLAVFGIQVLGEHKKIFLKERRVTTWLFTLLVILTGIFALNHIWGSLFEDQNQFYLYSRFLFVALVGLIATLPIYASAPIYCLIGILPGFMGVIASVILTNMSLETAMARMYIAVIASCFAIASLLQEKWKHQQLLRILSYLCCVLLIGGLIVSKLVLVRITGCLPVTIHMNLKKVTAGPAAGLLVRDELADKYNANIPVIKNYATRDHQLLYFGAEHIYYMVSDADLATPSVQGTAVYNEMYTGYYAEHPDKMPNLVIIDKSYFTDFYYNYSPSNEYMLDWIEEHFKDSKKTETEYLIIYDSLTESNNG